MRHVETELRLFLWLVDAMENGPQVYSLFLRAIWGMVDEKPLVKLDRAADLMGISVEDQIRFTDWAVRERVVASEGSFAEVFLKVLNYFSVLPRGQFEKVIEDHQTSDFELEGKKIGPCGLAPDDPTVEIRLNQIFQTAAGEGIRRLNMSLDKTGEVPYLGISFVEGGEDAGTFPPLRVSERFYSSLVLRLKIKASIAEREGEEFLNASPYHQETLFGKLNRMIRDKPMEVEVVITGQGGMAPEEVTMTFDFPEGVPNISQPRRI